MRRPAVFMTMAFLAGLGVGYCARSIGIGTPHRTDPHAADMAAIEKLHQKDIEVTLSQDPKGLVELPGFKVLSYAPEYRNTQIEDGMACEWGEHRAEYKLSPEAVAVRVDLKAFDVLRRQTDGSWKFAVLIGN